MPVTIPFLRPDASAKTPSLTAASVLSALSMATLVVDDKRAIRYANSAAEQLFQSSAPLLTRELLKDILPPNGPLFAMVEQAADGASPMSAYGMVLDTPKTGVRTVSVHVAPIADTPGWVVISLQEQTRVLKFDQQLEHRNSARSMTAMAALLAHEVKNPLSGIRGAAQLLGQSAAEDDKELTQLICDEADRIVSLVNRMEVFSDDRPLERGPVNIHAVMERVRRVAENGFGASVKFIERYDPSLPPVNGNHDQLVQVLLNLVKNAAEAVPTKGGEIILSTAFQPGVRVAVAGSTGRVQLPLVVTVQDNGPGIPEDIRPHLFDPFVTTKPTGSGLGLALVAKIITDHGGIIEFESSRARTIFKIMLPIVTGES